MFFSGDSKLRLIPQVGTSANIKKLFLKLSEGDVELLSAPKIITSQARSLSKLHDPALSNVILYPLYTYFSLSLFFTILHAPIKQFLNLKLQDFLAEHLNHRQCKNSQFQSSSSFILQLKDLYQILFNSTFRKFYAMQVSSI